MRRLGSVVSTFLLLALSSYAFPEKPAVEGPVCDFAGILADWQIVELQHRLIDFADSTSNQICVVTVNDLEGYSEDDFAIRIGREWNVGSDRFNNGVVFLIKPKTERSRGAAFIAVGRGLEEKLTDLRCSRIVNDIAIPYFSSGDYYSGISYACFEIMRISGSMYQSPEEEEDIIPDLILLLTLICFFIVLFIFFGKGNNGNDSGNRRFDSGDGPVIFPGGRQFRGNFGGGGFTGGFGGGFGGGSFGGGGGGGRW